ncbi:MAG: PrpF domain-containing protein [Sulfurospirillaceae bacterium]|nr:PrpF domain-containing protein [Sulfurospirillaceae bacterium]
MNDLKKIKCMLFRGGTSKGAFFLANDLPTDIKQRDELLLKIMGSPDPKQIDGIGGAAFVTSKVAILSSSKREGIDVDYKFVQVMVDEPIVDDKPTCGNILTGVGVFAIERGLVTIQDGVTPVRIYDINTGATISQIIQTPNRCIQYKGDTSITGVPGTAAPVEMYFQNIAGGKTGHYLPTKNPIDIIDGIEVTCLDISMPIVFVKAEDVGISGYETPGLLDKNEALFEKLIAIREKASLIMGLGPAKGNVIPKIVVISPPKNDGDINIRYFTPLSCHPTVAVSGGFCISVGCFIEGTLMNQIHPMKLAVGDYTIKIENPGGTTPISVSFPSLDISEVSGKTIRTARLLFDGVVYA